ncbi:Pinopsin [Orchesella cincta]|uniref:Pinopsin n=1 Tax=Orchesella cincta TaxID=48709 RepID=A0A1D2N290_ORCCI|nr:Pinopsin [Orchesella cincta]
MTLRTPMNMFLVNLSTADFITAFFGSPFPFLASIYGYWPFGETMCIIYAFGMSVGGITSITTMMVLAFERYLMIARPFRAADLRLQHSLGIVSLIWFYSLTITLPPLFGWASYGPEGPYISCSVSWERDDLTTKSYICFLFVLGLVLPLFTIIFSYAGIVSTIKSYRVKNAAPVAES